MVDYIQRKLKEIRGKRFGSSRSVVENCMRKPSGKKASSDTSLDGMLPQLTVNDTIVSYNDFSTITEDEREAFLKNDASTVMKSNPKVDCNLRDKLSNGSQFVIESLYWHNILRKKHNSPVLTLSNELCEKAQEWADILTHKSVFYHKNDDEIGENLLLKCSPLTDLNISGEEVTKCWYAEIDKYAFQLNPCLLHTQANRFTQLVWKDTKEFGIGKAKTAEGKLIVVANYRPAGNIVGEYHLNVLPLCEEPENEEDSESTCSDQLIHFECD